MTEDIDMRNWKEIVATANNQDPEYSFNLYKGIIDTLRLELEQFLACFDVVKEENKQLKETMEILSDDELLKSLKKGIEDVKAGRIKPLHKVQEVSKKDIQIQELD